MSSATRDKIKGAANEAMGKLKRSVGKATGSAKMQAKGAAQEAKGDVQSAIGRAKAARKK